MDGRLKQLSGYGLRCMPCLGLTAGIDELQLSTFNRAAKNHSIDRLSFFLLDLQYRKQSQLILLQRSALHWEARKHYSYNNNVTLSQDCDKGSESYKGMCVRDNKTSFHTNKPNSSQLPLPSTMPLAATPHQSPTSKRLSSR
jgi:hypothetical protein